MISIIILEYGLNRHIINLKYKYSIEHIYEYKLYQKLLHFVYTM